MHTITIEHVVNSDMCVLLNHDLQEVVFTAANIKEAEEIRNEYYKGHRPEFEESKVK